MKTKLIDIAQHTFLTKTTIALLGTCVLIGWTAVLNSFDFFTARYPKDSYPDATFYYPIPLKVGTCAWTFAMNYFMKNLSLKIRVCGCIGLQVVFMIALPILALFLQNGIGFGLSLFVCFLIGTTTCIMQNSALALVAGFDKLSLKIYWISTSLTGLIMNCGRIGVLAIFGVSDEGINTGIFVYYILAGIVMAITIVCFLKFLKSQYYLDMLQIQSSQLQPSDDEETQNQISDNVNASSSDSGSSSLIQQQNQCDNKKNYKIVIDSLKKVKFIAAAILMTYIIQYMLFPGVAVYQKTYHLIHSYAWATLLMQILYSLGDLFGKFLSGLSFYNIKVLYGVSILRCIFFFTFLMIAHDNNSSFFQNDIFALINISLLSTTNGFVTGGLMQLGPTRGSTKNERSLISIILGFSLTFGMAIGTFLALTLS